MRDVGYAVDLAVPCEAPAVGFSGAEVLQVGGPPLMRYARLHTAVGAYRIRSRESAALALSTGACCKTICMPSQHAIQPFRPNSLEHTARPPSTCVQDPGPGTVV